MKSHGVRFQPSLGGTLHLDRTNAFFLGGGKALMNAHYAEAEQRGIRVLYDAEVTALKICGRPLRRAARLPCGGQPAEFRGKALVAASGGFEANLEWLKEAWGSAADNFIVRGTAYNKGSKILKLLLDSERRIDGRSDAVPRRRHRRPRA